MQPVTPTARSAASAMTNVRPSRRNLKSSPLGNDASAGQCGASPLQFRVPDGDTLPRFVCASCGEIHYQNPKIVVGCLPEWEGRVLLCRRAIEPRLGLWTLPAGFLENGETVVAGAARETLEEADARVDILDLHTLISLPQIHQV